MLRKVKIINFALMLLVPVAGWAEKIEEFKFHAPSTLPETYTTYSYSFKSNKIYLPRNFEPSKKYSALIIATSCVGFLPSKVTHYYQWAKDAASRGYVTVILDSLGPRGGLMPPFNCGRNKRVPIETLITDLHGSYRALAALDFVKKTEIFALGTSLGAMTISSAISESNLKKLSIDQFITAGAGIYGGCIYGGGNTRYIFKDTATPLLWLMGGEDQEAPAKDCLSTAKYLSSRNIGFEYHLYDKATHCWDCVDSDGFTKKAGNGAKVTYLYDEEITGDSHRRVFEFFDTYRTEVPVIDVIKPQTKQNDACSTPAFAEMMGSKCSL